MVDTINDRTVRSLLIFFLRLVSLLKIFLSVMLAGSTKYTIGKGIFAFLYILMDVFSVTGPYFLDTCNLLAPFFQPIITVILFQYEFITREMYPMITTEQFTAWFGMVYFVSFLQFVLAIILICIDCKNCKELLDEEEKKKQAALLDV